MAILRKKYTFMTINKRKGPLSLCEQLLENAYNLQLLRFVESNYWHLFLYNYLFPLFDQIILHQLL